MIEIILSSSSGPIATSHRGTVFLNIWLFLFVGLHSSTRVLWPHHPSKYDCMICMCLKTVWVYLIKLKQTPNSAAFFFPFSVCVVLKLGALDPWVSASCILGAASLKEFPCGSVNCFPFHYNVSAFVGMFYDESLDGCWT